MIELYKNYFHILLHPIDSLQIDEQKNNTLKIIEDDNLLNNTNKIFLLSLKDIILLSWPFYFMSILYKFIYTVVFHSTLKNFSVDNSLIDSISSKFSTYFIMIDNYSLLFKFVLFPLSTLIYFKLWQFVITFTLELFDSEVNKVTTEQIVLHSFVSNTFLIIPILGPILAFCSQIVILFLGIKNGLSISNKKSLLIILTPLIMFMCLGTFLIVMYSMIFAMA